MLGPAALLLNTVTPRADMTRAAVRLSPVGAPPMFAIVWYTAEPIVYEDIYGGAERSVGRTARRTVL